MKQWFFIFALLFLVYSAVAQQNPAAINLRNGIEADILWPIFPSAFRAHYTHTLWEKGILKGDLLLGVNVDFPVERETEGEFADYSIVSGYRQYFWKGLHLEFSQTTGLGILNDHVTTGQRYESFDWLMSGFVGYRFGFLQQRLYILPQFGVAGVVYKSNPWPIFEDETLSEEVGETPFILGSLRLGFRF